MTKGRYIAAATALILLGSAGMAHAQSAPKPKPATDFRVRGEFNLQDSRLGANRADRSMQFDAKTGKWGLKLGLGSPIGREADAKDLEAGAYFKVTPSLRVGGAVGLASERDNPVRRNGEKDEAPRVRLETTFKF
ncbi:MAG: hypothetical protein EON95_01270 [Caulobacteraceae bacterium]|nr:hypothetical protein [Caulobacter sp.]RYF95474.1 MAG: hypothetical protein EON95_01270 [Caulobacteraceae bacterium]